MDTQQPLLHRAGGYDFANLWMNMAKLVIALVFLYQNALDTQLGVRLFEDYYYVFHVPVSQNPEADFASEVVTPEDPYFSIEFKPLALAQAYDEFTVQVVRISDTAGTDLMGGLSEKRMPCRSPAPDCAYFTWEQLTGGNKVVLHRASFDLLKLVGERTGLTSGDYEVEFGFNFFRHGELMGGRHRPRSHIGVIKFLRQEEQRYGDVPVVQGRPFRIPKLILTELAQGGKVGWVGRQPRAACSGGSSRRRLEERIDPAGRPGAGSSTAAEAADPDPNIRAAGPLFRSQQRPGRLHNRVQPAAERAPSFHLPWHRGERYPLCAGVL